MKYLLTFLLISFSVFGQSNLGVTYNTGTRVIAPPQLYLDTSYATADPKTAFGLATKRYVDKRVFQASNVAAAQALTNLVNNDLIQIAGRTTAGDGGGSTVYYSSSSTSTTNLGTIFTATGMGTGRLINPAQPLNVRWFGAKGDNVTSDLAAFQSAAAQIQMLGSIGVSQQYPMTNGVVYVPTGFYYVPGTIIVQAGHHFYGDGMALSQIRSDQQSNLFSATLTNFFASIQFNDLGLTGPAGIPANSSTNTAGYGISLVGSATASAKYVVQNVRVNGFYGGIYLSYAESGKLDNCWFTEATGPGVTITGSGLSGAVDFSISDVESARNSDGYSISYTSGLHISGSTAVNNRASGFALTNNSAMTIAGCSEEYNYRGMVLNSFQSTTIQNCYFNCQTNSQVLTVDPYHIYIGFGNGLNFSDNYLTKNYGGVCHALVLDGATPRGQFANNFYAITWTSPARTAINGGYGANLTEFQETTTSDSTWGVNGQLTLGTANSTMGVALGFKEPYAMTTAPTQIGIEMAYGNLFFNSSGSATSRHSIDVSQVLTNTATSGTVNPHLYNGNIIIFPNALVGDITFSPATAELFSNANGMRYTVRREGLGAFNLNIPHADGTLALTTTNQWAEIIWNGGTWKLLRDNTSMRGTFTAAGTATTCTGATIGVGSKANAGFVTSTTTGTTTCVVTFPYTAPVGWVICPQNNTTANLIRQTASSTTTATFVGVTVTGDVISYTATAY